MEFTILIVGVALLGMIFNLRRRVRDLEKVTESGSFARRAEPAIKFEAQNLGSTFPAQQVSPVSVGQVSNVVQLPKILSEEKNPFEKFLEWLKEDWLLKVGAGLLVIGFAWLTTYAFLNNWIGPVGRITLGVFAGIAFIILGWVRIQKYIHQGGIFLVLGSTTMLLTIFAAREVYDFLNPISALLVMFLSVIFVAVASVKYNNRALALVSLASAGIVPLLIGMQTFDYVPIFTYLLAVIAGTIWITFLTGRRELTLAALILFTFYSLPHITSYVNTDKGILLFFAFIFATLFFFSNIAGILKLKGKDITADLIAAGGNGLLLLAWIMSIAQPEWQSLIISAWMIVFVAGAFSVYKITQASEPFYVYAGVGVAMLAAATAVELSGAALTIAYTIECAAIVFVSYQVMKNIEIASTSGLLFAVPIFLSLGSMSLYDWNGTVLNKNFFVLLVLGLSLMALGYFLSSRPMSDTAKPLKNYGNPMLIAGSVYMYIWLWLSMQVAVASEDIAVMLCLIIYTIIGLITYFRGSNTEKKGLRNYGGALLGFVIIRLVFTDIWRMDISGRIITLFLIGTLLVSTAFFGKKKKESNLINK